MTKSEMLESLKLDLEDMENREKRIYGNFKKEIERAKDVSYAAHFAESFIRQYNDIQEQRKNTESVIRMLESLED